MLALAISVLAVASSCVGAESDLPWWKVGPVYQIFPASFADSDGDGWGDLQGIIDHADYLVDLGVGAIWLSPIYPSPMKDNGYDVLNFRDVNPRFGNLTVFDKLIDTFHEKKIKVVLDFVPNHSSNDSVWFQDSIHRRNGKDDWYVWRDPKGVDANGKFIPPNNWVSTFGGSAWEYVPERKQFYYHKFAPYQTDFNYSNPAVLNEMKETLRFWLRRGVDGFRMDAVPFIAETSYELNEPLLPGCQETGTNDCLNHIYTMNLELTHVVLNSFDAVLREDEFKNSSRAMWEEANNDVPELMTYYGTVSSPFNFQYITYMQKTWNASRFQKYTQEYMDALNGRWPNWVIGNHDNPRIGTRMGPDMIDSMNIIALLLPGTSITYYGEEIGMENMGNINPAQRKDNAVNPSRDPSRTPMQWNASVNAGFSKANPNDLYLPVNSNYYKINVANENSSSSHLGVYKTLVNMHKEHIDTTQKGFKTSTFGEWIFAFQRPGLVVVTNLNNVEETFSVDDLKLNKTKTLTVKLAPRNDKYSEGTKVSSSDKITLMPRSSVVFTTGGAGFLQISSLLLAVSLLLQTRNY